MRSWTGQKAWKNWSRTLATAEGDHFEREVLSLLRFLWAGMTQAPRLRAWDRRGIDLLVWADHGPFPCAVQCKGFAVQEIGSDQIRLIESSVQSFLDSDAEADVYLVVHNRDSRNPALASRVQPLLDRVVVSGKARRAEMWARHQIVSRVFEQMETRMTAKLHDRSRELLEAFERLFRFGEIYIDRVPASRRTLTFRRDSPCSASDSEPVRTLDVPRAISGSSGTRWTILTGQFGTGKTTSAMRTAAAMTRPVLLVPAATVPVRVFQQGTANGLTQHIIDSFEVFSDDDERRELRAVAGAVLSYLLRHQDSPFVFILDGLDEHHFFSSLEGLQRLANQLAEFACAVVLTTRREHLEILLGDFNVAFADLGQRFGRQRIVDTIELHPWSETQIQALVDLATSVAEPAEREHLLQLQEQLRQGVAATDYGDLIYHPLFLHFILEDVASEGLHRRTRPALLQRWIERKLRRDRGVWATGTVASRPSVAPSMETDEFIRRMSAALEELAFRLSDETAVGKILLESTPAVLVLEVIQKYFPTTVPGLLPILLNSVLVIHSRVGDRINVGFALRTLQEYLTAAYLVHHDLPADQWPENIRTFALELNALAATE